MNGGSLVESIRFGALCFAAVVSSSRVALASAGRKGTVRAHCASPLSGRSTSDVVSPHHASPSLSGKSRFTHVRLLVKCFRLKPHPVHTQYTPQTIRRDDHEFAEYSSVPVLSPSKLGVRFLRIRRNRREAQRRRRRCHVPPRNRTTIDRPCRWCRWSTRAADDREGRLRQRGAFVSRSWPDMSALKARRICLA
jgi:hypothetical protein